MHYITLHIRRQRIYINLENKCMLETSMCYKQDILKYIADYFSSNWEYKELFSIALLCCISDIHVWHPSTPPPFPKALVYYIKSKQFNHVKDTDNNPGTGELAPLTINVLLFVGAVIHGCLPILRGFSQCRPVLLAVVRYSLFLWWLTNFWLLAWPFLKLNVKKSCKTAGKNRPSC